MRPASGPYVCQLYLVYTVSRYKLEAPTAKLQNCPSLRLNVSHARAHPACIMCVHAVLAERRMFY